MYGLYTAQRSTLVTCEKNSTATTAAGIVINKSRTDGSRLVAAAAIGATIGAIAWADNTATSSLCEATTSSRKEDVSGENPIQHVMALLRLYEQIDQNMAILAGRMLENLEKKIEEEKKSKSGIQLSPEQRALNMSIEFETTLEKVQDAVFRNNYVTKEQVQDALQRLVKGELRGSGKDGRITVEEAEALDAFVKNLGRMRWRCTGSREPIIPTHSKPIGVEEKPSITLDMVVKIMEELIPRMTFEMENIAKSFHQSNSGISVQETRQQLSKEYIRRSGELTAEICVKHQVDLREFQAALVYYHDNPLFEQTLAHLSAEQQQKFAKLGL